MRLFTTRKSKNITTTPPALAVNTYPSRASSFELQGRSLVLNQLVKLTDSSGTIGGVDYTISNGLITLSGLCTTANNLELQNIAIQADHYYVLTNYPQQMPISSSSYNTVQIYGQNIFDLHILESDTVNAVIGKSTTSGTCVLRVRVQTGTTYNLSFYPQLIDLTVAFGPGQEPTTVDQLKSIIDLDKYIPYNPGTFIHNNATYEVNKWNQLASNGDFSNGTTGWNQLSTFSTWSVTNNVLSASWTPTYSNNGFRPTSVTLISGHKYYVTATIKNTGSDSKRFYVGQPYDTSQAPNAVIDINTTVTLQGIISPTTVETTGYYFGIYTSVSGTATADITNIMCIDLTDIFGAGKEPSTINECKLRFLSMGIDITKYQPYSPLGGQYCGYRNIWDEEWEVGDFNSTTGVKESGSRIINADYIPVLANTNYYVNNTNVITVYYYDSNKVFLGYNNPSSGCFESLPNSAYINFRCSTTYGTTYKNDISIYQVSNKVDLGFNQWDEEWEILYTSYVFSKNYIPVLPSTTYYFKDASVSTHTLYYYDSNKTQISNVNFAANNPFTTPAGCCFMKFSYQGATYHNDICINLSQLDTTKSPHNGDYRPYLMLRGIGSDFNVWDEQWETGKLDAGGQPVSGNNQIRSKNFIPVLPSTKYYYYNSKTGIVNYMIPVFYDINKNYVSRESNGVYSPTSTSSANYNNPITIPTNCCYIKFYTVDGYGTTYNHDICINLSQPQTTVNPHNGQYVPRLFDTYDSISGILTRRIGAVDLGTLNWTRNNDGTAYFVGGGTLWGRTNLNLVCPKYVASTSATNGTMQVVNSNLIIYDNGYATASDFKSAMNGVMLLYELATPTIETTITQPISFVAGKLGKQYGVVDLGSLSWTYDSSNVMFYSQTSSAWASSTKDLYCGRYITDRTAGSGSAMKNKSITCFGDRIYIHDTTFTNTTALKNSLQGQYLIYKLADSATNPAYATAGNLIRKTNGDIGNVDFTLTYIDDTLYLVTGNGQLLSVEV